jgi:hypothetical protein
MLFPPKVEVGRVFGGTQIYVVEDQPKMKLSADCPVTPEFRLEMDAWLIRFFGMENRLVDGEIISVGNSLHMNPRTFSEFKKNVEAHNKRLERQ